MNFVVYSIQLFFAALLHLSAVKVRAMQFGGFEMRDNIEKLNHSFFINVWSVYTHEDRMHLPSAITPFIH